MKQGRILERAKVLKEVGEYQCIECSTPNFVHLVIPKTDWEALLKGEEMKQTEWCPQHGYPLPCDKCGLGVREATLKEVGGLLSKRMLRPIPGCPTQFYPHVVVFEPEILMLKSGRMPDER